MALVALAVGRVGLLCPTTAKELQRMLSAIRALLALPPEDYEQRVEQVRALLNSAMNGILKLYWQPDERRFVPTESIP